MVLATRLALDGLLEVDDKVSAGLFCSRGNGRFECESFRFDARLTVPATIGLPFVWPNDDVFDSVTFTPFRPFGSLFML